MESDYIAPNFLEDCVAQAKHIGEAAGSAAVIPYARVAAAELVAGPEAWIPAVVTTIAGVFAYDHAQEKAEAGWKAVCVGGEELGRGVASLGGAIDQVLDRNPPAEAAHESPPIAVVTDSGGQGSSSGTSMNDGVCLADPPVQDCGGDPRPSSDFLFGGHRIDWSPPNETFCPVPNDPTPTHDSTTTHDHGRGPEGSI
jgi:hypothetical protein